MDQDLLALLQSAREALDQGNFDRSIATSLLFFGEALAAIAQQGVEEDNERPLSRVADLVAPQARW